MNASGFATPFQPTSTDLLPRLSPMERFMFVLTFYGKRTSLRPHLRPPLGQERKLRLSGQYHALRKYLTPRQT